MFKKKTGKQPQDLGRAPKNLQELLAAPSPRAVALWLADTDHDQRDTQLSALDQNQALTLTGQLTPVTAQDLLESVSPHTAVAFLQFLSVPVAAGLLDTMEADDATRVIELMNDDEKQSILRAMEYSHSALVRGLLSWPEDSAASRMRPEFLRVPPDATVQDAVDTARGNPDDLEEGVFVTRKSEQGEIVLGWLSPQSLVLGKRAEPVTNLMLGSQKIKQWSVKPLADQERVAHRVRARDSQVVPVMDDDVILGVITSDSVNDILHEEATEDAERQGGSAPLDVPYLKASPFKLWQKRVGWVLALFIAEMYTGTVMRAFEDELEAVVALAFFVPLLIGTGGNVGTQITTTLIRAMAQDGVRLRDIGRVMGKELMTALLMGVTMAVAGAFRAFTLGVGLEVLLTVGLALACIVIWSSFIASMLPLLLMKLRVDPAVVSGPMIATIVDGTGLMIYFMIAKWMISAL